MRKVDFAMYFGMRIMPYAIQFSNILLHVHVLFSSFFFSLTFAHAHTLKRTRPITKEYI